MSSDLKNWLDESAEKREEKIAKLETKIYNYEKKIVSLEASRDIQDLEQQATACDWVYKNVPDLSNGNYMVIQNRARQLRNQAKALKVGV